MKPKRTSRDKTKSTKLYVWKSSIPQKWLDIKGNSYFEHVNDTNKPHTTIQFLKETQKYINYICTGDRKIKSQYKEIKPTTHSPIPPSHFVASPPKLTPPQSPTENLRQSHPRTSKPTVSLTQRSGSIATSTTPPSYFSISRCPSQSTLPSDSRQEMNSDPSSYAVHRFAIPNGISSFPKLKSSNSERTIPHNDFNEFSHRFDKRKVDFIPVRLSRGFSGYKLTKPKSLTKL